MLEDENPEVVAAANLSPVSPRPLHNTYTLPQVLPELQYQAENPDVVPLNPTTFRTAEAAMAPQEPEPAEPPAEPVQVGGGDDDDNDSAIHSNDISIADDDSFDAYGEEENGQEQADAAQSAPDARKTAGPGDADDDDYARTFDSPGKELADVEDGQGEEQQPIQEAVSSFAPESMNISDHADAVSTQSATQPAPVDPSLAAEGIQTSQPAASIQDPLAPQPSENGQAALLPGTNGPAAAQQPALAAPKQEHVGVQPSTEDVEMNNGDPSDSSTSLDIQKLVDEITAKAEATEQPPANPVAADEPTSPSMDVDLSSLPPKPALTQEQSKQTYSPASYHHASLPNAPSFTASASVPSQPSYPTSGAPGTSQPQAFSTPSFASYPNAHAPGTTPPAPAYNGNGIQQTYDEFLADERKAMSEAKWERFPEGSRIFIGNLSQERVSKRDVYELFHKHGRLAQISLKSAYGFVQYFTVDDAQAAMNALQGAEVKGRKINLEISRTQKTKKDRDRSPERRHRDRGGRNADRYDGRAERRQHRQGRSSSPRRDDHRRQDSYNRDRGHYDSFSRNRSRSPEPYRRHGQDSYRRRSPSPYARGRQDSDHLDIPRRYGNDVPDVQILLMQDVHKDFVDWVQRAFWDRGLKTNAIFMNPRFPKDAVIQRQVLEGAHAVIELDMRAQTAAKIPLQVFDRSAGNNVRFDQYRDLDPPIAAQLVLRAKGSVAQQPSYPAQPAYPSQPYGTSAQYGYPAAAQQPPSAAPDLTGIVGQLSQMGNVDSATLQTILTSLQQPSHAPAMAHHPSAPPPAANPHADLHALINNISAASTNTAQPAIGAAGMPGYPTYQQQPSRGPPPSAGSSDPARDVENIMATLARIRQ